MTDLFDLSDEKLERLRDLPVFNRTKGSKDGKKVWAESGVADLYQDNPIQNFLRPVQVFTCEGRYDIHISAIRTKQDRVYRWVGRILDNSAESHIDPIECSSWNLGTTLFLLRKSAPACLIPFFVSDFHPGLEATLFGEQENSDVGKPESEGEVSEAGGEVYCSTCLPGGGKHDKSISGAQKTLSYKELAEKLRRSSDAVLSDSASYCCLDYDGDSIVLLYRPEHGDFVLEFGSGLSRADPPAYDSKWGLLGSEDALRIASAILNGLAHKQGKGE